MSKGLKQSLYERRHPKWPINMQMTWHYSPEQCKLKLSAMPPRIRGNGSTAGQIIPIIS